ncbi:MAG: hypothetical protein H8D67_23075 [Deltaproteobacteria bacterium]|nr:hypothetical protein [Deltaproteobacteria bacterium]
MKNLTEYLSKLCLKSTSLWWSITYIACSIEMLDNGFTPTLPLPLKGEGIRGSLRSSDARCWMLDTRFWL